MDPMDDEPTRAERRAAKRRARDEVAAEHPRAMFWVKVGLGIVVGFGAIALAVAVTSQPNRPDYEIIEGGSNFGITHYTVVVSEWPSKDVDETRIVSQAAGSRAALVEFRCRTASGPIVMTVTQKTTGARDYMPYYSVRC